MAATPSELVHRVERALAESATPPRRRRVVATAALGTAALLILACTGPRAKTSDAEAPSSPEVDQALVQTALGNLTDPESELTLVLQVNEPGTKYHTGLNGGEPTIPWGPDHKGPSVWVGRETECVAAGVSFASSARGQDSLVAFLDQARQQNPERKVTIQTLQGVVYADVVSHLDQVIAAGFVDIGFKGSYGDGQGNIGSSSNRILVRPEADQTNAGARAASALGLLRDLDPNSPPKGAFQAQAGLDKSEVDALRSLGYVADDADEEIASKLRALGYAAAPEENSEISIAEGLAALGDLEAPENDESTGPGEFAGYAEIDGERVPIYEEVGDPDMTSDSLPPEPAFTVHIDSEGTISIDSMLLVHAGSDDLTPLRKELVKRAKALKHKPVKEGSSFMVVDEPVLISMGMKTPFRRALLVYQLFGRADIAIQKVHFNFGRTSAVPGQLFSLPLPIDVGVEVEEGEEPPPQINVYASTSGLKLITPGPETTEVTTQEVLYGDSQELTDALVAAAKKWPSANITIFGRGAVTAGPIAGVLAFTQYAGLTPRIRFAVYMP